MSFIKDLINKYANKFKWSEKDVDNIGKKIEEENAKLIEVFKNTISEKEDNKNG